MRRHDALMRSAIGERGGYKTIGRRKPGSTGGINVSRKRPFLRSKQQQQTQSLGEQNVPLTRDMLAKMNERLIVERPASKIRAVQERGCTYEQIAQEITRSATPSRRVPCGSRCSASAS